MQKKYSKLVVVHNLRKDSLVHAKEIGGLPCPSFAVIRNDIPFDNFGEITLIADPKIINPRKINVYESDIYSSRQPRCKYRINKKTLHNKLNEIHGLIPEFSFDDLNEYQISNLLNKDGTSEFHYTASNMPPLLLAFARANNRNPRIPMRDKPLSNKYSNDKSIQKWYANNSTVKHSYDSAEMNQLGNLIFNAIKKENEKLINSISISLSENEEKCKERILMYEQFLERDIEKNLQKKEGCWYPLYRAFGSIKDDIKIINSPNRKEIDQSKLIDLLREYALANKSKFNSWIDVNFKSCLEDRYFSVYTNNGNEKEIPYTLDNIEKEMNKKTRDGEGFNYGPGSLRSLLSKQFNSYSEIEEKLNSIISQDEFDSIKKLSISSVQELARKLAPYGLYNRVIEADFLEVIDVLKDYAKKGKRGLVENYKDLPNELIDDINTYIQQLKDTPTCYFEAKFRRSISLDEFSGAIVPQSTNKEILLLLKELGLKTVRYEDNNQIDRMRAINEFEDLMFGKGDEIKPIQLSKEASMESIYQH